MNSKVLAGVVIPFLLAGVISCSRLEPAPTGPSAVVIVPVKLNELYSRGVVSNPDWIEIYNPNADSIDIGGYKIYNVLGKNGTRAKKTIPAGTYVRGAGYFVVVVNDTISTTGFDLSVAGETVWFESVGGTVIDSVAIPSLGIDSSFARKPDGASTWLTATPPTRGEPNSILPVIMNEIFSRGVAPDLDWIEMYNPNSTSVDIGGYKIYDAGGQVGTKPKKIIPAGTSIPANGFYALTVDSTDASGFGLSSNGETAWLENANGNIIDMVAFPAMPVATTSYGRKPDGSVNWQILTVITRGTSNN